MTWEPSGGNTADNEGKSFLLSIDLKQKMTLVKPEKAIYRDKRYALFFGASDAYDLAIFDQCDKNPSKGNFPSSYNCNGIYKNSQNSYT